MAPPVVTLTLSLRVGRALQEQRRHIIRGNLPPKLVEGSIATRVTKKSPKGVVHPHFSIRVPLESSDRSPETIPDVLRCGRTQSAKRFFGGPNLAVRREDDGVNDKYNHA